MIDHLCIFPTSRPKIAVTRGWLGYARFDLLRHKIAILIIVILVAAAGSARAIEPPYILVDLDSGAVLAERQSGELWYPASLTKLMTVYLVFEALAEDRLELDSPVAISEYATTAQPSRMGFPAGTIITVENALKILIVKSANDVAVAVAEMMGVSVSNFVAGMNQTAIDLGMTGTRFINPHGLPGGGQYSTARDMALLARTIWTGFPQFRGLFAIPEIRFGASIMPAGNSLLEFYPGSNGMKTGYICAAGFNVAATVTRGQRSFLAVVLGAETPTHRATTAAFLFDAGFATPENITGPLLSAYRPMSGVSSPVNLRSTMCPPDTGGNEDGPDQRDLLIAAFGEPAPLPPPVAVFTGGADPTARLQVFIPHPRQRPTDILGVPATPAIAGIPLPRPRPQTF